MVVYYVEDTSKPATMPRQEQFKLLQTRLNATEFASVVHHLNTLIGDSDIETSNWMPTDPVWVGTPLQPIFDKAAKQDYNLSAQLFGLMVFYTFMTREDQWITGRFFNGGEPMRGRTYFRKRY